MSDQLAYAVDPDSLIPGTFRDVYFTGPGIAIRRLLCSPTSVTMMETATLLDRVAVEPLGHPVNVHRIKAIFANVPAHHFNRYKQFFGAMAKQVVAHRGLRPVSQRKIRRANFFSEGMLYTVKPEQTSELLRSNHPDEVEAANDPLPE